MKKRLYKFLALQLVLGTMFGNIPMGVNAANTNGSSYTETFSDVFQGAWYYDYVQYVQKHGLMVGSEGKFDPEAEMTRAMVVQTLYNMEGKLQVNDKSAGKAFVDVYDDWYKDAVCWAYNEKITTGYNDGSQTFGVEDKVTREQLVTFLYRYANLKGKDTTTRGSLSNLKNGEKVRAYAKEAMEWAVGTGLLKGVEIKDNKGKVIAYDLAPQGTATRAQMATILQRFHAMDLELLPEDYYYASVLELLRNANAHNPSAYYEYFFDWKPFYGELYFAIENIDTDKEKELIIKMPKFQMEGQDQERYMVFQYSGRKPIEEWYFRHVQPVYFGEVTFYQNGKLVDKYRGYNEKLLVSFFDNGRQLYEEQFEIQNGVITQEQLKKLNDFTAGTEEVDLNWKLLTKDNTVLAFNPELEETKVLDNKLPWQIYINTLCRDNNDIWWYLDEFFHKMCYEELSLEKSDIYKLLPSAKYELEYGEYTGKISKKELEKLAHCLNLKKPSLPQGAKELPGGIIESYLGFIGTEYQYNFIVLNTQWKGKQLQIEGICNHYDYEMGMYSYKITITLEKDDTSVMYGYRVVDAKSELMTERPLYE